VFLKGWIKGRDLRLFFRGAFQECRQRLRLESCFCTQYIFFQIWLTKPGRLWNINKSFQVYKCTPRQTIAPWCFLGVVTSLSLSDWAFKHWNLEEERSRASVEYWACLSMLGMRLGLADRANPKGSCGRKVRAGRWRLRIGSVRHRWPV
jgi:hypothetical protein